MGKSKLAIEILFRVGELSILVGKELVNSEKGGWVMWFYPRISHPQKLPSMDVINHPQMVVGLLFILW